MANVSKEIRERSGLDGEKFRLSLKRLRNEMGLTQSQFARTLGFADGLIATMESKRDSLPSIETAVIIARTYGITLGALLGVNWNLNSKNMAVLGCSQMQDVSTIAKKIKQMKIEQMKDGLHRCSHSPDYYKGAIETYQAVLKIIEGDEEN